jgi:DNA-binding NarL/FixJ family response regulator
MELLRLLGCSLSRPEMANWLAVSGSMVRAHVEYINAKTDISSRAAVLFAIQHYLLS